MPFGSAQSQHRASQPPLDGVKRSNNVIPLPTLTFKVSEAEARTIRARAHAAKANVSAFLRTSALGVPVMKKPRKLALRKHPVSGLPYDASSAKLPLVTNEEVRALLADFP